MTKRLTNIYPQTANFSGAGGDVPADGEHDQAGQGLTLVQFAAQRKHILLDTLGA